MTTDCPSCQCCLLSEKGVTCEWGITYKVLVKREDGEIACVLIRGSRPSPRMERISSSRNLHQESSINPSPVSCRINVFPWERESDI